MTQSPSLAVLDSEEPTVQPLGLQRLRRSISGLVGNPMARQGALSLVDQTISSATNFVTSVIIGRLASREALGLYVLALSIVYLVRSVQDQIIAIPYRTYCHRRQGRSLAAYTGSILVHQFALSAAAMLLLGIVLVLTPRTLISANFARALWGVLGALPFLLARDCVRQVAFAQLRLTAAIVQDLAVCILQIGALLTLGFLHMLSVATVYLVLGTVAALVVAGWFALQHRSVVFRYDRIASDWRQNWSLARWALAALVAASLTPYIAPWFLAALHSEAEVGTLAACLSLVGLSQMFNIGIGNWLAPQAARAFASGGVAQLRRVLWLTGIVFAVIIGGFCLVFITAGDWLVVSVYGSKFAGCRNVVSLAALAILAHAIGTVAGNGLWAMEQPKAHLAADSAMLFVTLGAAALAVGPLGALGAAAATLAGAVAGAAVRTASLLRQMSRLIEPPGASA